MLYLTVYSFEIAAVLHITEGVLFVISCGNSHYRIQATGVELFRFRGDCSTRVHLCSAMSGDYIGLSRNVL